jgi:hypothetical protein
MPRADPLVPAAAQSGGRAGGVGDPLVSGAEDQRLDELVEDHRIVDSGPVTAERMLIDVCRQQREESLAQRVKDPSTVTGDRGLGPVPEGGLWDTSRFVYYPPRRLGAARGRMRVDAGGRPPSITFSQRL